MKILALISDGFGGVGGIAKFNRDFLTAFSHSPDCEEITAVPRLMPNTPESLPPKLNYVRNGLNGKIRYLTALLAAVRKNKPALIICGHINLCPAAYLAQIITGAPIVLVIHGIDAWTPTANPLANWIARRVDAFIAVSRFTKTRFQKWSELADARGFVLPNAVDLSRFTPGPKRADLLERYRLKGKKVLMTLGRLSRRERLKGIDEVLNVLPRLANEVSNIAYLIVGEGDDRKRIESKAQALGIGDRVVFTQYIEESEKADHYRLADAYVMPSRGEGFGIVFLEAMACGVPVVGSKLDASREALMEGKLGVLVDPSNPEELVEGILKGLSRPKGVVPEDLPYFSYDAFEKRAHVILDQIRLKVRPRGRG